MPFFRLVSFVGTVESSCQDIACLTVIKNLWQVRTKFVPHCFVLNRGWKVIIHLNMSFQPHCFSTSFWQRERVRCWRTEMIFQAICQQVLNNNEICLLRKWAIEFRHWVGHLSGFSYLQLVNQVKTQKYQGQSLNSVPRVVAQHTNHIATRPSPTVTSISRSIYQFNSFIFLITKLLSLWACAERLWLLIKMELY